MENIYETLYQDKGSSVKDLHSLLATGHGGKTHTFDLRQNVRFHSGNPFTCADAEHTFRRALVVNAAESWTWFLSEPRLGTPDNALNDKSITWARITKAVACNVQNQLIFNLAAVDPAFLAKLVFVGASIVARQHAIKIGEWEGTATPRPTRSSSDPPFGCCSDAAS